MAEEKKGYTIGISSGIFGAASQEERFAFTSVGLAKKAQYAITKGVRFVQIDLESISEFEENDIERKMKEVERLGINFAIHSETPSFGSREFPHLDSAIKPDYRRGHERMITILRSSARIGAKYVLVHSSESLPFQFLNRELQPTELVDPWGRNLADFILANGNIFLKDDSGKIYTGKSKEIDKEVDITQTWLWGQDEIWKDVLHDTPEGTMKRAELSRTQFLDEQARRQIVMSRIQLTKKKKIEDILEKEFGKEIDQAKDVLNKARGIVYKPVQVQSGVAGIDAMLLSEKDRQIAVAEGKINELLTKRNERAEKLEKEVDVSKEEIANLNMQDEERIKTETEIEWRNEQRVWKQSESKELLDYFLRLIQSRQLSYGPERIAYYIMAKWMQETDNPLWKSIIDVTVEYYAKKESITGKEVTPEQWLKDRGMEIDIRNAKFQNEYRLWVPAVSALYVLGHFRPGDARPIAIDGMVRTPDFTVENPIKILEEKGLLFIFETPMAGSGMEDLLRFPQPAQMYYLVREMKSPLFGIAIDIEHMLMDGLNVEAAIGVLPQDSGKFIRVIHTGYPSPLGPAHIPIPLGSDQQIYLYKTYWNLRQKGAGKDREVFMIFERGGGQDPIQQSIIALQLIKKFLEKDYPPEKLPLEFYGLDTGQWASSERQKAQILEHAFDPLKGMLQVPEEEHGFLGKASIEKGKGEEWRKEKYR